MPKCPCAREGCRSYQLAGYLTVWFGSRKSVEQVGQTLSLKSALFADGLS